MAGVEDFDDLCDLIVLEQLKNSVLGKIAMCISEQKVKMALADDCVLTHRGNDGGSRSYGFYAGRENSPAGAVCFSGRSTGNCWNDKFEHGAREFEKVCNYCRKRGHWKRDCSFA